MSRAQRGKVRRGFRSFGKRYLIYAAGVRRCRSRSHSRCCRPAAESWAIEVTYEDPTGVFPAPRSSTPTGFTLLAGSSNQFVTVGTSKMPIAEHAVRA